MGCNVVQRAGRECRSIMMVVPRLTHLVMTRVSVRHNYQVLVLNLLHRFFLNLRILFFLHLVLLGIVSGRDLNDGVDDHVEIWLLLASLLYQFLVDSVEGFGVDFFGQGGVFLGPVLKYSLEIGTYFIRLFEHLFGLFVEIKLHTVADNHQIQNETLVLGLVVGATNHILDQLQVIGDQLFLDIPISLLDHVGKENDLDFIQKEDFTDGFQHFEDGIFRSIMARFGDAIQEGIDPFHVVFSVETEKLSILGGSVADLVVLFAHLFLTQNLFIDNWLKQNLVRFYFKSFSYFYYIIFALVEQAILTKLLFKSGFILNHFLIFIILFLHLLNKPSLRNYRLTCDHIFRNFSFMILTIIDPYQYHLRAICSKSIQVICIIMFYHFSVYVILIIRFKQFFILYFIHTFIQKTLIFMQSINEKEYDQLVLLIQKEVKELQLSAGWECFTQGKVNGYKKKSQNNSVVLMASTIVNLPIQKVADFFMKDDSMQKLNDMVIQNKVLFEQKGKYKIFNRKIKTPFPMKNRQSISLATWVNEGSKIYLGVKGCNYPIEPTPKFVMSHLNIGGWIFERIDNNTTKVTNISVMDLRGNVPEFLKNIISKKKVQRLKDLQEIIKKEGN